MQKHTGFGTQSIEDWVEVALGARHPGTEAALGYLGSELGTDRTAARAVYDRLTLEQCGDDTRLLMRVRGFDRADNFGREIPGSDPRWHLLVLGSEAIGVEARALSAPDCQAALEAAPTVDAWLADRLARAPEQFPELRLSGAVAGQPAIIGSRREMALFRISHFLFAVHERRATADAVAFAFERLASDSELMRFESGADHYGPFDVLAEERARLASTVAANPALRAAVRNRPVAGPEKARAWLLAFIDAVGAASPGTAP